jgi:hypothetical protein
MLTSSTTGPLVLAVRLDLRLAVSFFAPALEDRGLDSLTVFLFAARFLVPTEVAVLLEAFLAGMRLLSRPTRVRAVNPSA